LLDPKQQPQFVNPLPTPAVAQPAAPDSTHYELAVTQFRQDLGLRDARTGEPLMTTVWGYGRSWPGPTIEARRGQPITVRWTNDLVEHGSTSAGLRTTGRRLGVRGRPISCIQGSSIPNTCL
jgi:spore coat protein A